MYSGTGFDRKLKLILKSLMYSGTGFDRKLKLILKSFPITMWIIQNIYENGTGNQCTLSNININASVCCRLVYRYETLLSHRRSKPLFLWKMFETGLESEVICFGLFWPIYPAYAHHSND